MDSYIRTAEFYNLQRNLSRALRIGLKNPYIEGPFKSSSKYYQPFKNGQYYTMGYNDYPNKNCTCPKQTHAYHTYLRGFKAAALV